MLGGVLRSSTVRSLPAMVVLAAAIVLGGGGSPSPGWELLLQLVFAGVVIAWALAGLVSRAQVIAPPVYWHVYLLALLVLAIPLLQLVPLPPSMWQALPGREVERQALELVGAGHRWMPWTMTPSRTLASLLAMIPPVVLMIWTSRLDSEGRQRVLGVIVAGGVASAILGALQLADGEGRFWRLQAETHLTWLTGFQANRNAEADVLLIALLAAAACWAGMSRTVPGQRRRDDGLRGWRLGLLLVAPLLLVALVLTGSRGGLLLLPIASIFALSMAWPRGRRIRPAAGFGALALAGAVVLAALQIPAIARVATRYVQDDVGRAMLWEDTAIAVAKHWPVGSGLGSFQPVFIASEQLQHVDTSMPVRAHNDWLEFTLEAGIIGWVALVVAAVLILARLPQLWRAQADSEPRHEQILFGFATILLIALHSLGDYPLRSMSLSCLLAVAVAVLFPVANVPDGRSAVSGK